MICLNELQFYSAAGLSGICLGALVTMLGIYILLEKKKEKLTGLIPVKQSATEIEMDTIEETESKVHGELKIGSGFGSLGQKAAFTTANEVSVKHELNLV